MSSIIFFNISIFFIKYATKFAILRTLPVIPQNVKKLVAKRYMLCYNVVTK